MKNFKLSDLIKIALLGVIAFLLMFVAVPIPIFPSFLKLDVSDLPALVGAFSLGPVAGVLIELVKNLLQVPRTATAGVGELANFLIGASLVFTAGAMYKHKKTRGNAVLSLITGTVIMAVVGSLLNYFVLLPLYETALHFPIKAIVAMGHAINPSINGINSFVALAIFPFNILKGVIISCITMAVYKKISPVLHKEIENNTAQEVYDRK
ncbi:ECF transporter S component [Clostridium hydrogenum]|uniref:ECF transporter S component n=1 Tax=Clostridium hydrogenum TaxID=2855764 RepID=UPI001F2BA0C7|nr:ECF transporter S component [Clostridium hydrogenum]